MLITLDTGTRIRIAQSELCSVCLPADLTVDVTAATAEIDGVEIDVDVSGGVAQIPKASLHTAIAGMLGEKTIVWRVEGGDVDNVLTPVEIVSAHYISVAAIRGSSLPAVDGFDDGDEFDDEAKYTDDDIAIARQAAEETIEESAHRSWTHRRRTITARADRPLIDLPDTGVTDIESVICDSEDITELCDIAGDRKMYVPPRPPRSHLSITYTYGLDAMPAQGRRAIRKLAALYLRKGLRAENARGESSDGVYVSFTLATGDEGSWTGIPDVDSFIEQFGTKRRWIG